MRFPRTSLAAIGFAILVLAVDFALLHALDGRDFEDWPTFLLFLMPMFDVLLIALYRLRTPERRTPGAVGFLIAGSAATLAVFAFCFARSDAAFGVFYAVARPDVQKGLIQNIETATVPGQVMRFAAVLSLAFLAPMALFCLPPLLAALAGGRLARRFWPAGAAGSDGSGGRPVSHSPA